MCVDRRGELLVAVEQVISVVFAPRKARNRVFEDPVLGHAGDPDRVVLRTRFGQRRLPQFVPVDVRVVQGNPCHSEPHELAPIVHVVFLVVAFVCRSAVGRVQDAAVRNQLHRFAVGQGIEPAVSIDIGRGHQVDLVPHGARAARQQQRCQGETSQVPGRYVSSIHHGRRAADCRHKPQICPVFPQFCNPNQSSNFDAQTILALREATHY